MGKISFCFREEMETVEVKTNYRVFERAQMVLCKHAYTWALVKYIEELKCVVPTMNSGECVFFDNSQIFTHVLDAGKNPVEFWK